MFCCPAPTYKKQRLLNPPFTHQVLLSSLLSPLNVLYDTNTFSAFPYNCGNIKLASTAGCFLPTSHYRRKIITVSDNFKVDKSIKCSPQPWWLLTNPYDQTLWTICPHTCAESLGEL